MKIPKLLAVGLSKFTINTIFFLPSIALTIPVGDVPE
jgi:hypothetical protein